MDLSNSFLLTDILEYSTPKIVNHKVKSRLYQRPILTDFRQTNLFRRWRIGWWWSWSSNCRRDHSWLTSLPIDHRVCKSAGTVLAGLFSLGGASTSSMAASGSRASTKGCSADELAKWLVRFLQFLFCVPSLDDICLSSTLWHQKAYGFE